MAYQGLGGSPQPFVWGSPDFLEAFLGPPIICDSFGRLNMKQTLSMFTQMWVKFLGHVLIQGQNKIRSPLGIIAGHSQPTSS